MTAIDISARVLLAALAAAVIAGCAATAPTDRPADAIEIRTQDAPATECMAALLQGTLVPDPSSGVGVRDDSGFVWQIIWPFGYSARSAGGRFSVSDATGAVIAHEGNLVGVGGGEAEISGTWLGCGGIVPPIN